MDERSFEALNAENERLRKDVDELQQRVGQRETELRASQALLAATIESLPFSVWARDREGRCFSQNAAARANWGSTLDQRIEDMKVPAGVLETWLSTNQRALSGEIVHGDVSYELKGVQHHAYKVLAPIRMDDAIVGTVGVNIDVTKRKQVEVELSNALAALRASEEKLRLAVGGSGIGLWSWDVEADVVAWDDRMCEIYGVPRGEAPRTREAYLKLMAPEDLGRSVGAIAKGVDAGNWDDERRIVRADGAVRWMLTKGTVLQTPTGKVVLGAVVDVTERRRRDEQLRQAQKLEAVGRLTAGIAHNFNNLLMGILPNVQMAADRAPPDIAPLLRSAEHAASRAADLVQQLMTYAGRNRPSVRSVTSVGPLVERVVAFCRTTFDRRIEIVERYDAASRSCVDATQIEQAILNILINARDALASTGGDEQRIEVTVDLVEGGAPELESPSGAFVRVRIRDNGPGMDAGTAARIYEPFFTTKEIGKGTGLGLATTHAILREHGGAIVCETGAGKGTMFSAYLPSETRPVAVPAKSEAPRVRGTETVLIVDDEPSVRNVVKLILAASGFAVRLAGSGQEAVALLGDPSVASEVALVLLDVSMPGMPAASLRSHMRELAPHARVAYFTGYAFEAPDSEDAVIEKPVSEKQLLGKIRAVLDRV